MFIFILINTQRNHTQGMSRQTFYVRLDTFELLGRGCSSLCHFYHVTILSQRLKEFYINVWSLNRDHLWHSYMWMKSALFASGERIFVRRSRRIREGALLRWQRNADRTEQCPDLCVALTGSRRVRVKVIILVIVFFWVFCFFDQINTARGLIVRVRMWDDEEWGWRGFEVIPSE